MQCIVFFIRGSLAAGRLLATLLALAALLIGVAPPAAAVPVTSLYVVLVPGVDLAQAAQDAMRVELVRLTGRRASASDPNLAALITMARQYAQLERATTSGQTQVVFDESTLSAALLAAGAPLWGADRPLLWVSLPPLDAAFDQALRQRLTQAAEERGLPLTIAPAAAAPALSAPTAAAATAPAPAPALTAQGALDAAHAAGASAALIGVPVPGQPGSLQWTLTTAEGAGMWVGGPEFAIDQAADTLASAAHAIDQSPVGRFACHISGVTDLAALVNALDAVRDTGGVSEVDFEEVDGDQLMLQLSARGSAPQLERAIAGSVLQATGTGADGLLEYRYVPGH